MGLAFKGHPDLAVRLIEHGADVGAQNGSGATALMFAATFKQPVLARLLLAHEADPAATDAQGRTAADLAEAHGHAELAERLREVATDAPPSADSITKGS